MRRMRSSNVGIDPGKNVEKNGRTVDKKFERLFKSRRDSKIWIRRHFVLEYMIDFAASSNLHGIKYIGDRERTIIEKVFWLFMFVCCVVLCSILIRKTWLKWDESPVIVSFAENPTPVWQIPYPAVTVCFETKAKQTMFNMTEYYYLIRFNETFINVTENERNLFEDVSMVCDDDIAPPSGRKFTPGIDIFNNIRKVSPNLNDIFKGCKWKNKIVSCLDIFSQIITEEGFCFTFNTLGANEMFRIENLHNEYAYLENNSTVLSWSLEDGYGPSEPIDTLPRRGTGYGVKSGLSFAVKSFGIEIDYTCRGPVQGFKILLHNPTELPRLSQQYFRLAMGREVVVAVKPNMMTTSKGLRSYDPSRRRCYFPSERYLRYFKSYTQANCDMECLSNFTYAKCGCVHFGMPRGPNMKVCSAGSMKCINTSQAKLVSIQSELKESVADTEDLRKAREVLAHCKCLPSCISIDYQAEISQADYKWRSIYRAYGLPIPEEDDSAQFSRVLIYFKEAQFITSRRSELYGQADFLAAVGGLLGLFMGFSILSVVEFIYYWTLRLICMSYLRRRAMKERSKLESEYKGGLVTSFPVMLKEAFTD